MLNANKVNARSSCVIRAHFCEFFLVLGRFLLFKNPVKYTRIFAINQTMDGHLIYFRDKSMI